jgi:phosphoenolpyruvate---glycerone phosphotransferase subunit DhaL
VAGATPSVGEVLLTIAAALRDSRDELNRLDGVAGDGDLGLTAGRAADALEELAPTLPDDPTAAARAIGMALARKAPSTGGTLIAFACLAAGKVELPAGSGGLAGAAALLDAARDEVARRGKVAPGDRTMLDALGPAVDALRASVAAGEADPAAAFASVARAADDGARATEAMEATTGRAGWLADRARGHEDAGARLVAIVFAAVAAGLGDGSGSGPSADRRAKGMPGG